METRRKWDVEDISANCYVRLRNNKANKLLESNQMMRVVLDRVETKGLSKGWLLLVLLSLFACAGQGPKGSSNIPSKRVYEQLLENSAQIVDAAKSKEFENIAFWYDDESMLMADYNPMIKSRVNIAIFYDSIFSREELSAYSREIVDVLQLSNRVIEIGLFTKTFADFTKRKGKYLTVWQINSEGLLEIRAESFGYLHEIDDPTRLVVSEASRSHPQPIDMPWELEAYNALGESNVIDRIAERSVSAYTEDGMYLPFADTIKSGKSTLLSHYRAYYEHPVRIDSIQIFAFACDQVEDGYIKYGGFYVDWSFPGFAGNTVGTGISYWRRQEDNSLRIHRQIGLHIYQ